MKRIISVAVLVLSAISLLFIFLPEAENPHEPGARPNEWFWTQRAWPEGRINHEAYKEAINRARTLRSEADRTGPVWEDAGPTNIGARVTDLAIDPVNAGVIYAAMASGGVFKSTDTGSHWTPIFDDQASLSIGSVAVDPTDPQTVWVGTGEANAGSYSFFGMGMFKSSDAGESWDYKGLEETRYIARVVVDPGDGDRVFAACTGELFGSNPERGVYRTLDGGDSWSQVLTVTDSTACIDLVMNPQDPDVLYAAMWERVRGLNYRRSGGYSSGIWKTIDGGNNWNELTTGLPSGGDVGRIGLTLCASQPNVLYAIYADDPGYFDGVYKSTNSGLSWTRTSDGALSGLYSSFGWWFGNIRVDPDDPNLVFALGLDFYRSTNGGGSWSYAGSDMHVDHHALAFDPHQSGRIFDGNDGGLYRSTSEGVSWAKLYDQPTSQFYAIAIDPQNPERLYGGTQDNGTLRTLTGNVDDWTRILGGDGFYCIVHPTNSNKIWAEYQNGGLNRSTNGGSSWSGATSGINSGDRRNWSTPVVMDPSNPETMYYGTYRLYRSTDGSGYWSAISGDLTGGNQGANFGTISTIAVAPSDPGTIYVGTDDSRVWVTSNSGGDWNLISGDLPTRWVTRVVVDPLDASTVYASFSGLRWDEDLPHVFKSTDRGANWQAISAGLPEVPVNVLLVDPDFPLQLFVGTDLGCYVATAPDYNWQILGTGLPYAPVLDLKFHAPSRMLVAGTHGRSMFRLDLSGVTEVESAPPASRAELLPNFPNPFNPSTEIRFRLAEAGEVNLEIVDLAGRRLRRLLGESHLEAGEQGIVWDGRDDRGVSMTSGVYLVRLRAAGEVHSSKIQLLK
jgi:hypothetical protein